MSPPSSGVQPPPLKDQVLTWAGEISATSKSVSEFVPFDRFCCPQTQEEVWERTKHNTKYFKSNSML
jgi:hypothetical protein